MPYGQKFFNDFKVVAASRWYRTPAPADLRPRLQAGPRGARGRPPGDCCSGRVRVADRAQRRRLADRPLFLRGIPAGLSRRLAKRASPSLRVSPARSCSTKAVRGSPQRSRISPTDSATARRRSAASSPSCTKKPGGIHSKTSPKLTRTAQKSAAKLPSWSRRRPLRHKRPPRTSTTFSTAALARVSLKDAVAEVAAATGEPRRAVYARALELSKESADGAPPAR